ncbi:MAE_28990/MAE_18760 family HEPN-like nuclease [Streptomyces diastaticus]|uniref:MAE_28990/MAE_18760 family HEPN-like nuclease n=1 Tax=Streptomyces diastaticus TaxID=1956 RepID=UPI0036477517
MKIRTVEQLVDRISQDLSWRKKELTVFRGQVERAEHGVRPALLRASVALLYAHWEGFIKNSCHYYLCYLASLRLSYDELRPELAALSLRQHLEMFEGSNKASLHSSLVRTIRNDGGGRAKIPTDRDAVRTNSNLNWERLSEILCSVGCDFDRYSQYSDLIDEQLLASRNSIAHGEESYIAMSEWEALRAPIVEMMDDISTQISNSAIGRGYLLNP